MKSDRTQFILLHGHLADEIIAIIQYVAYSETCDNSDHAELHMALLEMHNDFPKWLEKRIAFLENAPDGHTIMERSRSLRSPAH
jgi:bacterioferritin (cytochrome b1)